MLKGGNRKSKREKLQWYNKTKENKRDEASKERGPNKYSFVLHGFDMLHKICTSKLDISQSQKNSDLFILQLICYPCHHSKISPTVRTHMHLHWKKKKMTQRAELKPCFSLSQLQHLHWAHFQRERTREQRGCWESACWFYLDPEPDMTWKTSSTNLFKVGTAFMMTFLRERHRALQCFVDEQEALDNYFCKHPILIKCSCSSLHCSHRQITNVWLQWLHPRV